MPTACPGLIGPLAPLDMPLSIVRGWAGHMRDTLRWKKGNTKDKVRGVWDSLL